MPVLASKLSASEGTDEAGIDRAFGKIEQMGVEQTPHNVLQDDNQSKPAGWPRPRGLDRRMG